jgi:homoserine acetyltransferase
VEVDLVVMDLIQVLVHKQLAKLELPTLVVGVEVDRVIVPVLQEEQVVKVALV